MHSTSSNEDHKKEQYPLEVKTNNDKFSAQRKLEESPGSPNGLTENIEPDDQPGRNSTTKPKTILKQRSQRISKAQLQEIHAFQKKDQVKEREQNAKADEEEHKPY